MTPTIVDAKSEPAQNTVNAQIDTSGLAKALQGIIAANTPTTTTVNPAKYVNDASNRMLDLYEAYEKLRIIGKQLNGKLLTDPLPETLKIEGIRLTFKTVDDGKESVPASITLKSVSNVGDLSGLIANELGFIIMSLQQESSSISEIITKTQEQVSKARKSWEESNKDKALIDGASSALSDAGSPSLASAIEGAKTGPSPLSPMTALS